MRNLMFTGLMVLWPDTASVLATDSFFCAGFAQSLTFLENREDCANGNNLPGPRVGINSATKENTKPILTSPRDLPKWFVGSVWI